QWPKHSARRNASVRDCVAKAARQTAPRCFAEQPADPSDERVAVADRHRSAQCSRRAERAREMRSALHVQRARRRSQTVCRSKSPRLSSLSPTKGKPAVRRGRKATGLQGPKTAGLHVGGTTFTRSIVSRTSAPLG